MTVEKIRVDELAKELKLPPEQLLEHFKTANMRVKTLDQEVSSVQQQKIRQFIEGQSKGSSSEASNSKSSQSESDDKKAPIKLSMPKKITLRRQTVSHVEVKSAQGDKKRVNVTVVKKRTYVKRSDLEAQEEQKRQEELLAQQEREAAQKALEEKNQQEKAAEKALTEAPKSNVSPTVEAPKASEQKPHDKSIRHKTADDEDDQHKKKKKSLKLQDEKNQNRRIDLRRLPTDEEDVGVGKSAWHNKKPVLRTSFKQSFSVPTKPVVKEVSIPASIRVADLAQKMAVKASEVVKVLFKMGEMVTVNQTIDQDTAVLVVEEFGHKPVVQNESEAEAELFEGLHASSSVSLASRAPVVTIMGHVDHGKTTLLDYIRRTRVADKEAGGITQNIGAYHVETERGMITFLDTPGHEAFTAMRARGAKVTDLVILVVAADDGVMPQTIEAIQHAKAAGVPLIVAVNKMDKPEADPDRLKSDLSHHEVISEDWGGDTMFCPISAKQGTGIDELLEAILLQAEMLDLKSRHEGLAKGLVIEARLDKGRGAIASILVQEGTLNIGDIVLAGVQVGRVRAMIDENGHKVKTAGPSIPVEILGLSQPPQAGDELLVMPSERKAREVVLFRESRTRHDNVSSDEGMKLENLFAQMEEGKAVSLKIVLKTDVQGSLEALSDSLLKLSNTEVKVDIIARGVGGITGSDAQLAYASNAIIIGFNVRADNIARQIIQAHKLDVHYHSVIYDVIDEVKRALHGMLAPEYKQEIIGLVEVRDVFRSSKFGTIAGCMVVDGLIKRHKPVRILRDNVVIFEGELDSLRRFKDDVNEVKKGIECGLGIKNYQDIRAGDQIEVFEMVHVERTLS